jgi:hypothetical protein
MEHLRPRSTTTDNRAIVRRRDGSAGSLAIGCRPKAQGGWRNGRRRGLKSLGRISTFHVQHKGLAKAPMRQWDRGGITFQAPRPSDARHWRPAAPMAHWFQGGITVKAALIALLLLAMGCGSEQLAPDKLKCFWLGGYRCAIVNAPLCTGGNDYPFSADAGVIAYGGLIGTCTLVFTTTTCDPADAGASCPSQADDRCVSGDGGLAGYWSGTPCQ